MKEQIECKYCEYFDLSNNICLFDESRGYDNGECLHKDCKNFTNESKSIK